MDKSPVFQICMLQDDSTLVTAGRSIQCWNVETRTIVATFAGHTTDVTHLLPVFLPGAKSGYFLSAADADRCISAWLVIISRSSFTRNNNNSLLLSLQEICRRREKRTIPGLVLLAGRSSKLYRLEAVFG